MPNTQNLKPFEKRIPASTAAAVLEKPTFSLNIPAACSKSWFPMVQITGT